MPIIVGPSRRGTDQLYGLCVFGSLYSARCVRLVVFYMGLVCYD